MHKILMAAVSGSALLFATQAFALCSNGGGAVGGAAAGAVTGAVVGGPIGAAVGGVVGGTVGSTLPPTACSYVIHDDVPSVTVQREVVVGQPIPQDVELYPIPQTTTYEFAYVNGERVIVNPQTRVVVEVVR